MEVVIQPLFTLLNDKTLNDLVIDVSREYEGIRVMLASSVNNLTYSSLKKDPTFQSLFDTNRNQWNSPKLLDWFNDKLKPNKDRVILFIHIGRRRIFTWLEFCIG